MTSRFTLGAALSAGLLLAGPAYAHTGAHLHPHGSDTSWGGLLLVGLAVAAVAGLVALRAR